MLQDERLPKKIKFLEYFRELPVQKLAAGKIGYDENTITFWKKDDKDFCDHIEAAKSDWALSQVKKVKSKEWLLERLMKDHFAERKEFTGADGKDLIPAPLLGGQTTHVQSNDSDSQTT